LKVLFFKASLNNLYIKILCVIQLMCQGFIYISGKITEKHIDLTGHIPYSGQQSQIQSFKVSSIAPLTLFSLGSR